MSFTSENYFLFLLLASNAALVAISCFALFRFERRWRRIEDIWNSAADTALSVSADEDVIAQLEASQKQQVSQRHEATQRLEASQRLERHIGAATGRQSHGDERTGKGACARTCRAY